MKRNVCFDLCAKTKNDIEMIFLQFNDAHFIVYGIIKKFEKEKEIKN